MREHWEKNAQQVPGSPALHSGGGEFSGSWGWLERSVSSSKFTESPGITVVSFCLEDNPQNCSSNALKAWSWHYAKDWSPSIRF
jgi:hypothetical protein